MWSKLKLVWLYFTCQIEFHWKPEALQSAGIIYNSQQTILFMYLCCMRAYTQCDTYVNCNLLALNKFIGSLVYAVLKLYAYGVIQQQAKHTYTHISKRCSFLIQSRRNSQYNMWLVILCNIYGTIKNRICSVIT